jgi:hypothetical protein
MATHIHLGQYFVQNKLEFPFYDAPQSIGNNKRRQVVGHNPEEEPEWMPMRDSSRNSHNNIDSLACFVEFEVSLEAEAETWFGVVWI